MKKDKVLLFYADNIFMKRPVNNEPNTSSIHSFLNDKKIECKSIYNVEYEILLKEIEEKKPCYLGIGINFLSKFNMLREFIGKLKKRNKCIIIVYGLFANSDFSYINENFSEYFDFVIRGNPVVEFYNIIKTKQIRIDKNKIIFKVDKGINIQELCVPKKNVKNELNTMISRGCLNNCIFCEEKFMHKGYEFRTVENVIDEIKEHINSSDSKIDCWVFFSDLDFLSISQKDKNWIKIFCYELKKIPRKIKFTIQTRADRITNNKKNLELLKDVGLEGVSLGVESGSNEVLNRFNKGIQSNIINYEALNVLQELNILYKINFIMYEPMTSMENIKENLNFLEKVQFPNGTIPSHPLVSYLSKLIVLPGSSCYKYYVKKYNIDFRIEDYIVQYDFIDEKVNLYYRYVLLWRKKIKGIVKEHYRLLKYALYNMVSLNDSLRIQHIGIQMRRIDMKFMKDLFMKVYQENNLGDIIDEYYSFFEKMHCRMIKLDCYNMKDITQFRGWHGAMNTLND